MPQPPKADPARGLRGKSGPQKLPAEGRKGDPPAWPLSTWLDSGKAETEATIWRELWATPQAVAWERLGWVRTVARLTRLLVDIEDPDRESAVAPLHAQATALEDRLGLTPKAMRLLLWEIVADEVNEQRQKAPTVRRRIKAV